MLIFGHRGAAWDAPENTLAAIEEGLRQGADGVEIDTRLSADGKLMVIHDWTYKRTAGYKRSVAKTTSEYAKTLDAGSFKNIKFAGEKVPLLSEVLDAVPQGKQLQIEIKSEGNTAVRLADEISASRKDPSEIIVIGFGRAILGRFKELAPKIKTAWINGEKSPFMKKIQTAEHIISTCHKYKFDGIDFDCHFDIDEHYVKVLNSAGLCMYSWTVDDPECAEYFATIGIDGIASNRPGYIRDAIK